MVDTQHIVSRAEWLEARKALLVREKAFTKQRDELSVARRSLPRVQVDKDYRFTGEQGQLGLGDLFGDKSQLAVYHFMLGPDATVGCKSCTFWADHFSPMVVHLNHRDVAFAVISRGPFERLQAYARRFGWTFPWVSSQGSDFNFDYGVSFTPEQLERGATYNYGSEKADNDELPGFSVFAKDPNGAIFHTYSTYGRGIEDVNTTYRVLDLVPKGRDEGGRQMAWVRRRDEYDR